MNRIREDCRAYIWIKRIHLACAGAMLIRSKWSRGLQDFDSTSDNDTSRKWNGAEEAGGTPMRHIPGAGAGHSKYKRYICRSGLTLVRQVLMGRYYCLLQRKEREYEHE